MPTFTAVFWWCRVGKPVCAAEVAAVVSEGDVAVDVCVSVDEEVVEGFGVAFEDRDIWEEVVGVGDVVVELDVCRKRVSKNRSGCDSN